MTSLGLSLKINLQSLLRGNSEFFRNPYPRKSFLKAPAGTSKKWTVLVELPLEQANTIRGPVLDLSQIT